jgi:hypothetical protein
MRHFSFPIAAAFVLLAACSSHAAEKPRPAQANQNQPKKVWSNDDLDELRTRGLISIVGQEPAAAAARSATSAQAQAAAPVYASRLDDPQWYADEAADLQAQLDDRRAQLEKQQQAIALAKERITQPGLSMDKPDAGVTPAAGVANLAAQVQEVQSALDELSDLARQHNIEPGELRG